jgi:hypothetical protein
MPSNKPSSINKYEPNDPQTSGVKGARPGAGDSPALSNNIVIWAQYAHLARVAPGLVPPITSTDLKIGRLTATLWTSVWTSVWAAILEGFTLYGASIHPIGFLPVQYYGAEQHTPNEISSETRPAPPTPPETAMPESSSLSSPLVMRQSRRMWARAWSRSAATLWAQWRRERDIRKAVTALRELDDRAPSDIDTLRQSRIEQIERYYWDS